MFRDRDFEPRVAGVPGVSRGAGGLRVHGVSDGVGAGVGGGPGVPEGGPGDRERDLGLEAVFAAMAAGDGFLLGVARAALLASLGTPAEIEYRQRILEDCLAHPAVAREMYTIATETLERERRIWGFTVDRYPEALLHRSLQVLELHLEMLKRLRGVAATHRREVRSEGLTRLFDTLAAELDDAYLDEIEVHLTRLGHRRMVLLGAQLGEGNKAAGYSLASVEPSAGVLQRVQAWIGGLGAERSSYTYEVDERDLAGLEALGEIRARGLSLIAAAMGHVAEHVLRFFAVLRAESGFYVGGLNLKDRLEGARQPIAVPVPVPVPVPVQGPAVPAPAEAEALRAQGLYDAALALTSEGTTVGSQGTIVGNDVAADGKRLIVITGANRGGKTTFLRSLGQAQLMMQCGLFVPARSYRGSLCRGVLTHFKREETPGLAMGKLEEELRRMSAIVDRAQAGGLVLCNESFASTNEREGSEIARQIVRALIDSGVKVVFVTHLFDFARGLHASKLPTALYLRAERLGDGRRTFRIIEGEPLPTSYGPDLYRRFFSCDERARAPG